MKSELIELGERARAFRKEGKLEQAVEVLSVMIQREPGWEHGACQYEMAICCEGLGRTTEAQAYFRGALSYDPASPIFLGGLASHLYLHGEASEAFEAHLNLLRTEISSGDTYGAEQTKIAIAALGRRLGLTDEEIEARIRDMSA